MDSSNALMSICSILSLRSCGPSVKAPTDNFTTASHRLIFSDTGASLRLQRVVPNNNASNSASTQSASTHSNFTTEDRARYMPCDGSWRYPELCVEQDCVYVASWSYLSKEDAIRFLLKVKVNGCTTNGFNDEMAKKAANGIIDMITSKTAVVVPERDLVWEQKAFVESFIRGGRSVSFYQTFAFIRRRERQEQKGPTSVLADQRCSFLPFSVVGGTNDSYDVVDSHCETVCRSDLFVCDSRLCIYGYMFCDGRKDCKDGTDESAEMCANRTCSPGDFRCSSGKCIPTKSLCDNSNDCQDGDDEGPRMCRNFTCPDGQFKCGDHGCTQKKIICDVYRNCPNGEDEAPELCRNFTCPDGKFKCGVHGCRPISDRCDHYRDCPDGHDEGPKICKNFTCPEGKFRCGDLGCLRNEFACNVVQNCQNGEDEAPELCRNFTCPNGKFKCGVHGCRPNSKHCDSVKDCPNGEDELNCQA